MTQTLPGGLLPPPKTPCALARADPGTFTSKLGIDGEGGEGAKDPKPSRPLGLASNEPLKRSPKSGRRAHVTRVGGHCWQIRYPQNHYALLQPA